ncbi:MAG: DNA repair protein RecO [Bacteroidetes bacterium]|nr:DNA repair protein RecO [Bacteroidota bacterium]MBS1974166.1 DNA repair protein RecO [Bacteroidota bacterium]
MAPVHKTKGIVLRTVKYGETSLIVDIYTELFGRQSYLVNGVRVSSKKRMGKANLFQPAAILEMEAYYNELKNLQRIKEFKWSCVYKSIFFDVVKNSVALFMVELFQKCLKQPEANSELFYFVEDAFIKMDESSGVILANYPLYFSLHLASFFGLRIDDNYSEKNAILDLQEGFFVSERPMHNYYLDEKLSFATSQLLKTMQPEELDEIGLNKETRKLLLNACQDFLALHIQDFGKMRSLPVLQELLA